MPVEFIKDVAKGMFGGGNYKQTMGTNVGKLVRKNPVGVMLTGLAGAGTKLIGDRLDKLDQDIAEYEEFWENRLGHKGSPKLEDYEKISSYVEDGVTYTRDDYDPMKAFSEDIALYWEMRPLDMEWR